MNMKLVKAVFIAVLIAAMALSGCASKPAGNAAVETDPAKPESSAVVLKLFSNLPDRKNGQGLVEQLVIDEYMKANPGVKIEVETLDEEPYKTKFKAYAMDGMPDVVSIWGQPSFLDEVLEAGVLAELNEGDYSSYNFVPGSLDGFKKGGKLYGLPRNTDIMLFFYNQKLFDDNGWKIPATYDELIELGKTIQDAGLVPVAMDGGDGWPLAIYLSDLVVKINGGYNEEITKAISEGDFSNPIFAQACEMLAEAAASGLFQTGFDSQDYGTAMNLFTNGQAAMFYMGSWESSMALNQDISEDIRNSIRAFTMPTITSGKGGPNDITAWNGGGYAVSASSEQKSEAIKFLNYLYQPDKLSKYGWENGVGLSAQDQSGFMTGSETVLLKSTTEILKAATNMSGVTINDRGSSAFKTVIETEIQPMATRDITVSKFLEDLEAACK
jgi:raffinose/stachyose/melibiose transport system substrate-binding protein